MGICTLKRLYTAPELSDIAGMKSRAQHMVHNSLQLFDIIKH